MDQQVGGQAASPPLGLGEAPPHLVLRLRSSMQIFVRLYTGETTTLEVKADETIASVKSKIEKEESMAPMTQRLILAGTSAKKMGRIQ